MQPFLGERGQMEGGAVLTLMAWGQQVITTPAATATDSSSADFYLKAQNLYFLSSELKLKQPVKF